MSQWNWEMDPLLPSKFSCWFPSIGFPNNNFRDSMESLRPFPGYTTWAWGWSLILSFDIIWRYQMMIIRLSFRGQYELYPGWWIEMNDLRSTGFLMGHQSSPSKPSNTPRGMVFFMYHRLETASPQQSVQKCCFRTLNKKMPWKKMEIVSTNHENIMVLGKKMSLLT